MPRIESLNILLEGEGKAYLSELYGSVIENVQKDTVSSHMKNKDLSGDPEAGSVEAKRFANATPKDYGTARGKGKGDAVKAKPVVVAIDQDKEIVEELEAKDIKLLGVDGVLDRRSQSHAISMVSALDKEFFAVAYENAVELEVPADTEIEDEMELAIQELENTQNDYVDGVPRALMHMVLSTKYYGKVRNHLDKVTRSTVDSGEEEFHVYHGVACYPSVHLPAGCDWLLMVDGAVAQPAWSNGYVAEKIPLSEAYGVSLFYHNGTAAVTPDLILTKAKA
ncbi:MAG: hypothetical protein IJA67_10430 [Oscillospiraceae bacterium]|nr:hypothetical protein [Oscillospiraceae bacterium]